MNAALLMPSKYLAAADFRGKDFTLTITKVAIEQLEREDKTKETKGIITLKETPKLWILNKTNIKTLIALFGSETDNWTGKQVTLYPEPNDQSESGVAIRIRGSPHLAADLTFTLKLPRKKPRTKKLIKTEPRKGTAVEPYTPLRAAPEPEQESEPEPEIDEQPEQLGGEEPPEGVEDEPLTDAAGNQF